MNNFRSMAGMLMSLCLVTIAAIACTFQGRNNPPKSNTVSNNTASAATNSGTTSTEKGVAGIYDSTGTNPNGGTPYKATLVVTPRDDVYQFSWDSGANKYDGVGVMRDDMIAVSYTDGENGKGCGVVLYEIDEKRYLFGVAGYWGVNKAEKETAMPARGGGLEGEYSVRGTSPDGSEYTGTLDLKKDGEGYAIDWNTGNSFSGYGIKMGDYLAISFGGKQCAFVAYDIKPDGTLEGKWGGQGVKSFGTETAKKR